jgi:pyruvate dehydrogenase E2 component (dihydrolipoamide acetyltransferase)
VSENKIITLPDLGDFEDVEIIEILVGPGDEVEAEQSIIVLESDKATMEIPSPYAGTIESLKVGIGDRISEGSEIASIKVSAGSEKSAAAKPAPTPAADTKAESDTDKEATIEEETAVVAPAATVPDSPPGKTRKPHPGTELGGAPPGPDKMIHASPSIRRYARELGVSLEQVIGSGTKGRVLKSDVKALIKATMSGRGGGGGGGITLGGMPEIDHSRFGEVEVIALSRIKKISGAHLHRSWVNVPHVTQFDEADITDLEAFRKSLAKEAEKKSVRLTPLIFLMKAVVSALREYPDFNASLEASGESLILKKYFNIGVAVDTPNGLMVPVIRDVDNKGLFELAGELGETAGKAREGKLSPTDLQGGCFTISSLGGIGGTNFTPIVNAPEVAILGVARSKMQPVYQADGSFSPRLILPLALSYDHRVIDGAQGARFSSFLSQTISDIRRVLL